MVLGFNENVGAEVRILISPLNSVLTLFLNSAKLNKRLRNRILEQVSHSEKCIDCAYYYRGIASEWPVFCSYSQNYCYYHCTVINFFTH